MQISVASLLSFILFSLSPIIAMAHGPHVHGKGELSLIIEGDIAKGHFRTPMDSLLGFEYAAKTEKQKKSVRDLQEQLKNPFVILTPPLAAGCQPIRQALSSALFESGHSQTHSDLDYEFEFKCSDMQQFKSADITALASFKRLTEVRIQLVTASQQKAFTVKKRSSRITF